MTEMLETANIIHNATERSFVILDELWRWTSTFDGMSLAKAIVVYLCQEKKVTTLFATHYHELTDLEWSLEWMKNYHVSVYENQQDVVFLKKVIPWRANKSYWLDVAKLAGIPQQIISAAGNYLKELELKENSWWLFIPHQSGFDFWPIDDMYRSTYDAIKQLLWKKHVHDITPIESLLILQEISIFFDE
jgi:DNA mismatch repair ATPase MutS